jgi:hypothetical protein
VWGGGGARAAEGDDSIGQELGDGQEQRRGRGRDREGGLEGGTTGGAEQQGPQAGDGQSRVKGRGLRGRLTAFTPTPTPAASPLVHIPPPALKLIHDSAPTLVLNSYTSLRSLPSHPPLARVHAPTTAPMTAA